MRSSDTLVGSLPIQSSKWHLRHLESDLESALRSPTARDHLKFGGNEAEFQWSKLGLHEKVCKKATDAGICYLFEVIR